jgi:hypothetical protein
LLFVRRPKLWRQRGSASGNITLTRSKSLGHLQAEWCGRPNSERLLSDGCGTASRPFAVAP